MCVWWVLLYSAALLIVKSDHGTEMIQETIITVT
jgi:hypothetical protein